MYKLLKDLPDVKAGELFFWNEYRGKYVMKRYEFMNPNTNMDLWYEYDFNTVENNPYWFEKVN